MVEVQQDATVSTPDVELNLLNDEVRLAKAMNQHEKEQRRNKRSATRSSSRSTSATRSPSLASIDELELFAEQECSPVAAYCEPEVEVDESRIAAVLEHVITGLPHEAYQHGTEIQYYSETHTRWLPGTIDSTGSGKVYNVIVGPQNQRRSNVPLENIRLPFSVGDTIEYLVEEGHWAPAVVTRCSRHSVLTVTGYSIRVTATGEYFDRVPSERLRYHFLAGTKVWMYDPRAGPTTSAWSKVVVSTLEDTDEDFSQETSRNDESSIRRWRCVSVIHKDSIEHIPSYLLRLKQPEKISPYERQKPRTSPGTSWL
jgi:hypothetical protein